MNLKIVRLSEYLGGTHGMLLIEEEPFCLVLELPWRENQKNISCIPEGDYVCKPDIWDNHKPKLPTWQITNVPGRSQILFHIGNHLGNTLGCPLLGFRFDSRKQQKPWVADSERAFNLFVSRTAGKIELNLKIVSAPS